MGYEYTRINFGGDAKILTNIDKLRIGQYARSGGGTVSNQPADVAIDNFALGRVDNANNANAAIVPFEICVTLIWSLPSRTKAMGCEKSPGCESASARHEGIFPVTSFL